MERIDKIISEHTRYSRKEIKKLISQKAVYVNGETVKNLNVNTTKPIYP